MAKPKLLGQVAVDQIPATDMAAGKKPGKEQPPRSEAGAVVRLCIGLCEGSKLIKGLLQGELPKAEGVPLPIDNALFHRYGCSLPHVYRP